MLLGDEEFEMEVVGMINVFCKIYCVFLIKFDLKFNLEVKKYVEKIVGMGLFQYDYDVVR